MDGNLKSESVSALFRCCSSLDHFAKDAKRIDKLMSNLTTNRLMYKIENLSPLPFSHKMESNFKLILILTTLIIYIFYKVLHDVIKLQFIIKK